MKYPMSMSIIVVDLGDGHPPTAQVTMRSEDATRKHIHQEIVLGDLSDATDPLMWAQMAAARVCDGL